VRDSTATIGAGGFVDVPIRLTDTLTAGGLTYLAAVIDVGARTGAMSNVVKVALRDLPPGSAPPSGNLLPASGDFDLDNDVDGADFLAWQRGLGLPAELALWQANFGSVHEEAAMASPVKLAATGDTSPTPPGGAHRVHTAFPLPPISTAAATDLVDEVFRELGGDRFVLGKARRALRR
jgi:hypothetical protein